MASETEIPPQLKLMIGAICTIVFEACCGHILEIFKIKRQTTNKSMSEIYHILTDKKGLIGIWDGFVPWGLLMSLSKGSSFSYGHQMAYNMLGSTALATVMTPKSLNILSSGLGGLFQGLVMSPLLLLKTRVITHDKFRDISGGIMATITASFNIGYEIMRDDGPLALCKGIHVFSFKRFCDWITRFLFVEMTISGLLMIGIDVRQSVILMLFATLFGGILSALSTSILDVMTALIQDANAKDKGIGFREGFDKVSKGLYLRIWHVALTTVVMKNSVPFVCHLVMQSNAAGVEKTEI